MGNLPTFKLIDKGKCHWIASTTVVVPGSVSWTAVTADIINNSLELVQVGRRTLDCRVIDQ